jgi:acylphosphatase
MDTVTGAIILIYGKVQGVWFRKHVLDKALELGLNGFVRNEPDGSVYIETTGTIKSIESLSEWARQGSPGSDVTMVDTEYVDPFEFDRFEIRH